MKCGYLNMTHTRQSPARTLKRVYRTGTNDQLGLNLCFSNIHHSLLWLLSFLEDGVHQGRRSRAEPPTPTHHHLQHHIGCQLLLKDQALTFSLTVSIFVKLYKEKYYKNLKVCYKIFNFIWGDFKPQKCIPGYILILFNLHNLSERIIFN